MTQAETSRGRGRPKAYDELELVPRIRSIEDLARIEANFIANGETAGASRGASAWLGAIKAGDPTGGVSGHSQTRFRHMLARLQSDPLGTPPTRRRRIAARQRGTADVVYVSAAAGAMALASSPAASLVVSALAHRPPIMLRTVMSPAELELAA